MAPFHVSWHTLLEELDGLPEGATLITPLSHTRFGITDVQEQRVVIRVEDSDEKRPLQRDNFETLYRRLTDEPGGFELDRLPPDADPYPAVWSLHPRIEIDEDAGVIVETDEPTTDQLLGAVPAGDPDERSEPDLAVYADALLLVDALERHDVATLSETETDALVNLYTLLSDVQRNANDLRQDVADVLLTRLHHDRPVSGAFGSVQRTTRRNRSLKDDDEILAILEDAGIQRQRVMGIDRSKLDDALAVTEVSETGLGLPDVPRIHRDRRGDLRGAGGRRRRGRQRDAPPGPQRTARGDRGRGGRRATPGDRGVGGPYRRAHLLPNGG